MGMQRQLHNRKPPPTFYKIMYMVKQPPRKVKNKQLDGWDCCKQCFQNTWTHSLNSETHLLTGTIWLTITHTIHRMILALLRRNSSNLLYWHSLLTYTLTSFLHTHHQHSTYCLSYSSSSLPLMWIEETSITNQSNYSQLMKWLILNKVINAKHTDSNNSHLMLNWTHAKLMVQALESLLGKCLSKDINQLIMNGDKGKEDEIS